MPSRILAAGGVVWRGTPRSPEVAVIHRPHRQDWSLPKGKLTSRETMLGGAFREVGEETGLSVAVQRRLGSVRYRVDGSPKTVEYWAMRHVAGTFTPNDEADRLRWLRPDQALRRLDFPTDRDVMQRFCGHPPADSVILLTRHAKAGKRSTWKGDDSKRPLDAAGRRQAASIADFAAMFAPDRICAATPVRCVQTVTPLAEKIGLPIQDTPIFSDLDFDKRPRSAVRALRELAHSGQVVVVSSQGNAIPGLLGGLPAGSGPFETRKGSVWALFFARGDLVQSDYYPAP